MQDAEKQKRKEPKKPSVSAQAAAAAVAPRENAGTKDYETVSDASGQAGLRKKHLIDRVVQRSGVKKKDAKPVVEAMLAELGEMLSSGQDLILPPLGKLHVNREKPIPNGRVLIVKIRQRDTLPVDTVATSDEP
jgi:DNA-binding protein HU-alpha